MFFKRLRVLVLLTKVASALEGLRKAWENPPPDGAVSHANFPHHLPSWLPRSCCSHNQYQGQVFFGLVEPRVRVGVVQDHQRGGKTESERYQRLLAMTI